MNPLTMRRFLSVVDKPFKGFRMPRQLVPLPRATVWVDSRGRMTVPEYMRDAAKMETPGWVTLTAEPKLEGCKAIMIRPEAT